MTTHPKRSRPLTRSRRQGFRPEILGLEERTMMASGLAAASAEAARSTSRAATSIILGEVATLVAAQPLNTSLVARLNTGIKQHSMTRQGALERILQAPRVQAGLVQSLTEELLNREPTAAESRALVATMQTRGVPGAFLQIMAKPEYYSDQGATDTSFAQAATLELLHRPATSQELAAALTTLNRGGASSRVQFLTALIGTRQFRVARTQDAYQQFAGSSATPTQHAAALKAFQGPLGYTKMLAQVLASGASSTGIVPTLAENSGLSVKRVPGFLAGWKVPDLAAPYEVANVSGRSIDNTTVDYWAITLNALDSVLLTIVPTNNPGNTGFAVRIWGPDGKEIGTAMTGAQVTFVAKNDGTYIMGISTKGDTSYAFLPSRQQPTPPVPVVTYTAEFQTYPGTNTNTVDILQNYKNPAYTNNNWPVWTGPQAAAYAALTAVASAGAHQPDPGLLANFTDFEQVGDITFPETFSNWLAAAWAPFSVVLNDYNNPQIAEITYPQIYKAYSETQWQNLVAGIAMSPDIRNAYTSVHQLLETADVDRSDIYNNYLLKLESWSTATTLFVGKDASSIATLMKDGPNKLPAAPKAISPYAWLENLLAGIVSAGADAAGALADGLAPGSGSFVGLAVSAAGDQFVDLIDSWLDGDGVKPPPTKPPATTDITAAATAMDSLANNAYVDSFELLTNQTFLTKIFSNYGLLEAMGTSQFTYSPGDQITPAVVLQQNYDRSVWEQLLPQMYSWREIAPTDDGGADTLPNFTFFIPATENARWQSPNEAQPSQDLDEPSGYYTYPADESETKKFSLADTDDDSLAQAIADARTEVVALQSGTQNIAFPGYDFTPYDSGGANKDYFGPGPVNTAQMITGEAGRFYTISTDSKLSETLYRHTTIGSFGPDGLYQQWYTAAHLTGVTIHQWALEASDGNKGWLELPTAAADALFGVGPAVLSSPAPIAYRGGGSYFNFAVPTGGLVSRFDVFTQWGKDVPGFAPGTLATPPVAGSANNMEVGTNSKNYFTKYFNHSYVTSYSLTYGSTAVKSVPMLSKGPAVLDRGPHPAKRA